MAKTKTHEQFIEELLNINCNIKVLDSYVNSYQKIQVKCTIDNNIWTVTPNSLLNGRGCPKCGDKNRLINKRKSHCNFVSDLYEVNQNIQLLSNYINSKIKVKCKCKIDGYEWDAIPSNLINSHHATGCPVCNNSSITIVGINDMWTTNPEQAKLLFDHEDGYKYTQRSSKRVLWKCPHCGEKIANKVDNVFTNGLSCKNCSDGISYPEKIMLNVLDQLDIKYNYQQKFNWSNRKVYDFYIYDMQTIIEVHGDQHFSDKLNTFGCTASEVQNNDLYKRTLALENEINNYIEIDARQSDLKYIYNSIFKSKLSSLFDLSKIDWDLCEKNSLNSYKIQACDLWNNGLRSTTKIAKILNISSKTIRLYLKQCAMINMCDYNSEESLKSYDRRLTNTQMRSVTCLTTGEVFKGISCAREKYGKIDIISCCVGDKYYAGISDNGEKLVWRYLNTDNSYIRNANDDICIIQKNKDGQVLNKYDSIIDFFEKVSIPMRIVVKNSNGNCSNAGGYMWEIIEGGCC